MDKFDVIVIGAGQGGLPAAHLSANLGARVALIEMREVGGT
jgi:glutathione reductase (NADPH)